MIINTLHASNECGPLGPAPTSAVFAFDLTDVSTLVPYTPSQTEPQQTRQLYLSDLGLDCSAKFNISKIETQTHYTKDAGHRCNPRLAVPIQIKRYGYPYWSHCGNVGYAFGLFDPPYAQSPVGGPLVSTTTPSGPTGPPSATTIPTSPTQLAPSTSTQIDSQPTTSLPSPPAGSASSPPPGESTSSPSLGGSASSPSPGSPTSSPLQGAPNPTTTMGGNMPPTSAGSSPVDDLQPTLSTGNGNQDNSPPPASVTTVSKQIASLGPSGVVVINEDGSGALTTSTYGVPAYGATAAGQGSGVPQASIVVYQNQTLTLGGPAATITGAVVVLPAGSTSATSSGRTAVVTGAAPKGNTGGLISLVLGVLALVCLI